VSSLAIGSRIGHACLRSAVNAGMNGKESDHAAKRKGDHDVEERRRRRRRNLRSRAQRAKAGRGLRERDEAECKGRLEFPVHRLSAAPAHCQACAKPLILYLCKIKLKSKPAVEDEALVEVLEVEDEVDIVAAKLASISMSRSKMART
ncbi:MAG: hypothetical protein P4L61_00890, partial [Candidatus Pacebacteria bacterium]|nr:hypothetical protein [Candidatus Paceibacterota bacterium]